MQQNSNLGGSSETDPTRELRDQTSILRSETINSLLWIHSQGFEPNALLDTLYSAVLNHEFLLSEHTDEHQAVAAAKGLITNQLTGLCRAAATTATYFDCFSFAQAVMRTSLPDFPAVPFQEPDSDTKHSSLHDKTMLLASMHRTALLESINRTAKVTGEHSLNDSWSLKNICGLLETSGARSRFIVYAGRNKIEEPWQPTHAMIVLGPTADGKDLWVVHKASVEARHPPSVIKLQHALVQHDVQYQRMGQNDLNMALLCPESFKDRSISSEFSPDSKSMIQIAHDLPDDIKVSVSEAHSASDLYFLALHHAFQALPKEKLNLLGVNASFLPKLRDLFDFSQQAVLMNDGRSAGAFDVHAFSSLRIEYSSWIQDVLEGSKKADEELNVARAHVIQGTIDNTTWREVVRNYTLAHTRLNDLQKSLCEIERQILSIDPCSENFERALSFIESINEVEFSATEIPLLLPRLNLFLTLYRFAASSEQEERLNTVGLTLLKTCFYQNHYLSSRYEIAPTDPVLLEDLSSANLFSDLTLFDSNGLILSTLRRLFTAENDERELKEDLSRKIRQIISIGETLVPTEDEDRVSTEALYLEALWETCLREGLIIATPEERADFE